LSFITFLLEQRREYLRDLLEIYPGAALAGGFFSAAIRTSKNLKTLIIVNIITVPTAAAKKYPAPAAKSTAAVYQRLAAVKPMIPPKSASVGKLATRSKAWTKDPPPDIGDTRPLELNTMITHSSK